MKRAGKGRIVTISSRAGLATSLTGIQAYASAKHGQLGLVRQLAHELGQFGITVNSVAPGFLGTSPDYEPQWNGYSEDPPPLRRPHRHAAHGPPEDIADAVLFLASDYASWITGQILPVIGSPSLEFLGARHDRTKARSWNRGNGAKSSGASWSTTCAPASAAPEGVEGRRALRRRDLVRLRPRDQRAARRRQVDRPPGLGPVRQPGRRAAHPQAPGEARREGDLLRARRGRPAASRRAARADSRGPRDRHPWLDP